MGCTREMQLEHAGILATLQTKVSNIETTLTDFAVIKETLIELKILSKQSLDFNLTQLKSNKEVERTLMNINENLNQLNTRMKAVEEKDVQEEISATELRVENTRKSSERFKAKATFYGVIATGVFSIVSMIIAIVLK